MSESKGRSEDGDLIALLPGDRSRTAVVLTSLLTRYDESHRRYHGGHHVRVVTRTCQVLAREVGMADASTVFWAAMWHDAVYDPRSGTNEADSAALAAQDLATLGVPSDRINEVARLIMLTAGHAVAPHDMAGAVLVDADLAVLGADPSDYAAYVAGVRHEYSFVDDEAWRVGRGRVLAGLLELPALFHTAPMVKRNDQARRNVTEELRALTGDASS